VDSRVIRRVRAEEWERLRDLRLAALADAPMAFGSTLAAEQAFPDSVWRERAATGAAGTDRVTFIADDRGRWVGSATGVLSQAGAGERPAWIVGMWVEPGARRRGVAQGLLRAVAEWARERGADVLHLDVTETNIAAIALYERLGFRASGETAPLPHTPSVREQHMQCPTAAFQMPSDGCDG
jgi:GNAT superfamily N-acetyltransferase